MALTFQEQEKATGVTPRYPFRLTHLEEAAYSFLCPGGLWTEDCSDGLVEHRLEAPLRQS